MLLMLFELGWLAERYGISHQPLLWLLKLQHGTILCTQYVMVHSKRMKVIFWSSSCAMSNFQLPKVGQEFNHVFNFELQFGIKIDLF